MFAKVDPLPKFALQVRTDFGWRTLQQFQTLDDAAEWLRPGCRVLPVEESAAPRNSIFREACIGASLAAVAFGAVFYLVTR